MQHHIEPFDNKNNPIVDVDNKTVPLVYFNHVKLKHGESFNYFLENHESIVSVVSGSIDVFVNNIFDTIIGDPEADVEVYADSDTDHRYVTVNILDKVLH